MTKGTATITANGVTANMDDAEATAKVLEGVRAIGAQPRQTPIWDEYDSRRIYKSVVEYVVSGEKERTTLYCYVTSFELARDIVNHSYYMTERHGHIVSIAETAGVWVQ